LLQLKQQGFIPDVIYGHYGWGTAVFVKDVLPQVPFVGYFEWFYNDRHEYVGAVYPPGSASDDEKAYLRMKNSPIWVTLQACDHAVTPTLWQRSQFPIEFHSKFTVLHDGVDTNFFQPVAGAKLELPELDMHLSDVSEIITFVSRALEPSRGFAQFIEALDTILKERPQCHVVIVGSDRVEYNRPLPDGKTYKQLMLERFPLDLNRVHFTGWLDYDKYRSVLQASTVHVYLTYPFILSWSLMESLACGCLVVASDTGPLQEIIQDGYNGFLVDINSPSSIARRILDVLKNREKMVGIGQQARKRIMDTYNVETVLPRRIELLNGMIRR
jgi:glycosyltransferase involved in cell wall biosynthesis